MTRPATHVLEISGLRVRLGGRDVLDGVSLSLEAGEAVALVGPNGSGKSTLLRAVLGLVPYRGTIRIDGHDAWRNPVRARARVAWVPQRPSFGDATAAEWMRFLARVRGAGIGRVEDALRRTGLETHARRRARDFSGGMQQRLAIAGALLADAALLLLDEATASLDRQGRREFVELASSLRKEGRTLLFASHRPEEVERLSDRAVHLEAGRVITPSFAAAQPAGAVVPLFRQEAP